MSDKLWKVVKTLSIVLLIIDIVYILFTMSFMMLYRYNVLNIVTDTRVFVVGTIVLLSINAVYTVLSIILLILKRRRA